MARSSSKRKAENESALAAFGISSAAGVANAIYRTVHEGNGTTVYTIGYERRDGEDLIAALHDAGVDTLVDVRERAFSRKPDFRKNALAAICEEGAIEYVGMPSLGSTKDQRNQLHDSGDFSRFRRKFKRYAEKELDASIDELAKIAKRRTVALLCYERCHDECHRSILTEFLVDRINATVVAIA